MAAARRPGTAALVAILVVALLLRLTVLNWGLPAINDPDELIFELGGIKLLREATLNPGWFGHPATTTLYLLALINTLVFLAGHLAGLFPTVQAFGDAIYHNPAWVILPGRASMALFGVACVYLTYRLGAALFDRRVALVGAALLAVSPIHVIYSQVIRSDIMATAFLLLMLLATVRYARSPSWRHLIVAAIWFGFTTTTKWPFAACATSFAAVACLQAARDSRNLLPGMARTAGFGLAGLAAIIAISPYLVLDYQTALRSVMGEAQIHHVGANGQGPLWNAGWYLREPLMHTLGLAGLGLALAGLWRVRRNSLAAAIIVPPLVVLSLVTISQNLIWIRWVLPLLPLLCLLAASSGVALYDRQRPSSAAAGRAAGLAGLLLLLVPPLYNLGVDAAERQTDTRQIASAWAKAHLPAGSTVIVEHFAFDLLDQPWAFQFPLADAGCVNVRAFLAGKVQYRAIDALRGGHHNVDYGTITPAMRGTCTATHAIISQYDRYAAESQVFPAEMAIYRELLARSTVLKTVAPVPGRIGGPTIRIIRIDRPFAPAQARQEPGP